MGEEGNDPDAVLDDITFLARSSYRVRVLEALASRPFDRHALQEATDVPRVTLGRVLDALQAHGWIRHRGKEYAITPLGSLVVEAFEPLVASVRAARKLRPVVEWLPTRELDFDLVHLADATITLPSRNNPLLPVSRGVERLESAMEVRLLASAVVPQAVETSLLATVRESQRFEAVLTAGAIESIRDNRGMARQFAELVASDRADVYRYDGDIPCIIGVLDGVVDLGLEDDQGLPRALIETEAQPVREWADSTISAYKHRSESVEADGFTDHSASG